MYSNIYKIYVLLIVVGRKQVLLLYLLYILHIKSNIILYFGEGRVYEFELLLRKF